MKDYFTYLVWILTTLRGLAVLSWFSLLPSWVLYLEYGLFCALLSPVVGFILIAVGYPLSWFSSATPTEYEWSELNGKYTISESRFVWMDRA